MGSIIAWTWKKKKKIYCCFAVKTQTKVDGLLDVISMNTVYYMHISWVFHVYIFPLLILLPRYAQCIQMFVWAVFAWEVQKPVWLYQADKNHKLNPEG